MWTAKTESLDNADVIQTVICAFAIIMEAAVLSFLMWAAANGSRYSKKNTQKRLADFLKSCCCILQKLPSSLLRLYGQPK